MRRRDEIIEQLFTVERLEEFVSVDHSLRPIRLMINDVLAKLDGLFSLMYLSTSKSGRLSFASEALLHVMLLQVFYSIRLKRQLMEQAQ